MIRFWFAPHSPRPLALMRIGLALVLLAETVGHATSVVETYSTAGRPLPAFPDLHWPVPLGPGWTVALHGGLIGALLGVGLGLLTRVSLLVSFVLSGWFALLDFPGTLTKYTAIALHLLVLLSCGGAQHVWSVDRRLRGPTDRVRLAPGWPRRLMQVLVCHVYLGAAITKMRMREFAAGDTLGFSLIDDRWAGGWLGTGPGAWLATHPRLLVLASFATLAFEFGFPLLVWFERTRRPLLVLAVLFHLALACTLSLSIFSPLMLVALLAFVEERDLAWWPGDGQSCDGRGHDPRGVVHPVASTDDRLQRGTRGAVVAGCAWFVLVGGIAGLSWFVQRTADPSRGLGTDGPRPPRTVPNDEAARMLADEPPPAATLVHRVDLGRRASHFHVFGDGTRFAPDDVVHVLLRFQQGHRPVVVRAILVAPGDVASQPSDRHVPREQSHLLYQFQMTRDFPAGTYTLRLEIDDELVDERTFEFRTPPP